jgi:succinyl-CoA synthetase alpha subunit/GNAT superfamily N-acetyltransferase
MDIVDTGVVTAQTPTRLAGGYALLTDGACVRIRRAEPADWQPVHDFAAALSRESVYHRFFGARELPGKLLADAVCAPIPAEPAPSRGALLAILDGAVAGVAEWFRGDDPAEAEAEVAFSTADGLHGHGVATLLAEHLLDEVEGAGIRRLTAVTQAENRAMLGVFAALGLPVQRELSYGIWTLTVDLDLDAAQRTVQLDAAARRERVAGEASLRYLLTPESVAVIGDRDDPATVAICGHPRRAVRGEADGGGELAGEEAAGMAGGVEFAGPDGADLRPGVRPDLAVITSPPVQALAAARVCASRGVRALVVTATGFDADTGRALLDVCHAAGMRLLGPGSLGVANPGAGASAGVSVSAVMGAGAGTGAGAGMGMGAGTGADANQRTGTSTGLHATLSSAPIVAGHTGVVVQSGGVGLALLSHLARLGIGISTFAGVGEKYDVSANDLLMHWENDPQTRLGLLHVESFGNPRKFARTARRLSGRIPLLAVDPDQPPSQARTALYAQAGITVVASLSALVAAAALLACQPVPRGRRVSVIGNTRGMVGLTVQACLSAGLDVVSAVNLTPGANGETLRRAMTAAAADDACDALMLALAPTAGANTADGFGREVPQTGLPALDSATALVPELELEPVTATATAPIPAPLLAPEPAPAPVPVPISVPVLAVLADQAQTVTVPQSGAGAGYPAVCYNDAAVAAAALVAAVSATHRQTSAVEEPREPVSVDRAAARTVIESCLRVSPQGRRLHRAERADLLHAFQIDVDRKPPLASRRIGVFTVTAWQDRIFGPVMTCVRRADSVPGPALLAPAAPAALENLARRVVTRHAADKAEPPLAELTDLLARVATLIDACPQAATMRLTVTLTADGAISVTAGEVEIAAAGRSDPYLRRLRTATVG